MRYEKHYTLEEARNELPKILSMLEEIVTLKVELDAKGFDVFKHQYFGGMGPNGQKVFPTEMERLVVLVQDLHSRGIEIKDLDKGLIDFPHIRANGEEVYLCYMVGEKSILAWHPIEGGFAARKSIDEL
jgi:hypothetical protein